MIRGILLFLLIAACAGCRPEKEKTPPGLIGREAMVQLLADLHLAQALAQSQADVNDPAEAKKAYYQAVLKKHGISYSRFKKSMDHYATHPEALTVIYDQVIEELSRRQAEATAVAPAE
jgi:hypothetical protein